MALSDTTIWELQTGGSDTNGAGAFDPGQTAGMFTDGAATSADTSAPVFTSASYNFAAGDQNAWLFIGAGTNWSKGWYQIVSVAANAATLDAAIGHAVLVGTAAVNKAMAANSVAGCATVASPTSATWSIDYSQQAASQITYTDLSSTGIGLTASSAAHPIGKQQVGNSIVVTGGTHFTTGRYVLASVSGVTGTFLGPGNLHTDAGTDSDGAARLGGALASPGLAASLLLNDQTTFQKAGTYSVTSASTNIAAGCVNTSVRHQWIGYQTYRNDDGTPPLLQASGISTATLFKTTGPGFVRNINVDGAGLTALRGLDLSDAIAYKCGALNCTNNGITSNSGTGRWVVCSATGCSTQPAIALASGSMLGCVAYANTITGFSISGSYAMVSFCLSYSNTGATTDGFDVSSYAVNCVAYANGRDGFRAQGQTALINCIAESNVGVAFSNAGSQVGVALLNCAHFGNGSVVQEGFAFVTKQTLIAGSGTLFTNAAAGDFSLNATAGGACRAAGLMGLFPPGLTTGYLDIGAAQHADPAGTGSRGSPVSIFSA